LTTLARAYRVPYMMTATKGADMSFTPTTLYRVRYFNRKTNAVVVTVRMNRAEADEYASAVRMLDPTTNPLVVREGVRIAVEIVLDPEAKTSTIVFDDGGRAPRSYETAGLAREAARFDARVFQVPVTTTTGAAA
jgi:hypothetical protein